MNRRQRRAQVQVDVVDLNKIIYPWQMTDKEVLHFWHHRMDMNIAETKHPLHHRTASGVIVFPDPTMEYYLDRMRKSSNPAYREDVRIFESAMPRYLERTSDIPPAVPVNRKYYGHDPYERH